VLQYFAVKNYENQVDQANKNLFLNCLVNARRYCPGTELVFSELILKSKISELQQIKRINTAEALSLSNTFLVKERSKNILKQIVDIMGTTGRIHIVEEPTQTDEMILSTQCVIDVSVDPKFSAVVDINKRKFDFINVCVIEGAPASVSEINSLLLWSIKESSPLIILARSFPEEITNTLAVNWNNGKLKVIPLLYGNTISNINSHADVASVSSSQVISALKGDTLNNDLTEKLGSLTNVTIRNNSLSATPTVPPHILVKNIKERLAKLDWSDKDRRDIFLSRLAGLSDKTLTIRLNESIETWKVKNEIEIGINIFNASSTNVACITFDDGTEKIYPLNVYKKAKELQNVYDKTISSIGGYLITPST